MDHLETPTPPDELTPNSLSYSEFHASMDAMGSNARTMATNLGIGLRQTVGDRYFVQQKISSESLDQFLLFIAFEFEAFRIKLPWIRLSQDDGPSAKDFIKRGKAEAKALSVLENGFVLKRGLAANAGNVPDIDLRGLRFLVEDQVAAAERREESMKQLRRRMQITEVPRLILDSAAAAEKFFASRCPELLVALFNLSEVRAILGNRPLKLSALERKLSRVADRGQHPGISVRRGNPGRIR